MTTSVQEQEAAIQEFYRQIADLRPIEKQLVDKNKPQSIEQESVFILAQGLIENKDKLRGNVTIGRQIRSG